MNFERLNAVLAKNARLGTGAKHERHIGTVNVGIE
jgi:hypothetical protein